MPAVISDAEARRNLAENLTTILRMRGLTQSDLAEAANRPPMSINHVCHGRRLPSVMLVAAIAEALNYSVEDLIGPPARIASREMLASRRKKNLIPA